MAVQQIGIGQALSAPILLELYLGATAKIKVCFHVVMAKIKQSALYSLQSQALWLAYETMNQSLEVLIPFLSPSTVQMLFMVIFCWDLSILAGRPTLEVL